jgi:hypothetical protein
MFLVWNEDIPLREMQPERVFFLYLSFLAVVADNASLLMRARELPHMTSPWP